MRPKRTQFLNLATHFTHALLNSFRILPVVVALLTTALLPNRVPAQDSTAYPSKNTGYLASYWHNGMALVKSPLHWNVDQWIVAGSSLALTGIIISMDEAVSQPMFNWTNSTGQKFGNIGHDAGSLPVQFGISGLALGIGAVAKNAPLKNFALDNLQAQLYTGGITYLVKEAFHRARPETGEGAYAWYGPFKGKNNESFFSGHTSLAFSTATMIFLHSKRKWWVGVLSYGAATAIGLSRMQQQKHWASDVVMGAVIGSSVSMFVYKQQQKRRAALAAGRAKTH